MAQVEIKVKLDLPEDVELLGYERVGEGRAEAVPRADVGVPA
jgi:hypothetical protein